MHAHGSVDPAARVALLEERIARLEDELREVRRSETRLLTSEEKLAVALNASGIGLWTWDRATDTVQWDGRLCVIFRVDPADAPTDYAGWAARVHPDDLARVERHLAQAAATGEYGDIEHRVVRGDGTVGWILAKGSVRRDADGAPQGIMGGVIDITERKRIEEHMRQAQKMEAVGQLAAGVAHNFNNMLAIVLSNVDLAGRDVPAVAATLAPAREAVLQAASIVRELMLLSGRHPRLARRRLDPRALVRRSVEFCRTTFDRRITLREDVAREVPAVDGQESQIEQALLNVLINARDAVSEVEGREARIDVRLSPAREGDRDLVRIEVRDTGAGMEEAVLRRAFEPFFTTKAPGQGTGLGLTTTYAILRDHGGAVRCDSALGRGTTVVLELPACGPVPAEPSPPQVTARPGRGERVLIVDDERLLRRVLRTLLEREGYAVLEARDGLEALDVVREHGDAIDLIVLDHSMPNLSGAETLRRLRATHPHQRVIGYSGLDCDMEGVDAMLQKPATPELLLTTIRSVLERTRPT